MVIQLCVAGGDVFFLPDRHDRRPSESRRRVRPTDKSRGRLTPLHPISTGPPAAATASQQQTA